MSLGSKVTLLLWLSACHLLGNLTLTSHWVFSAVCRPWLCILLSLPNSTFLRTVRLLSLLLCDLTFSLPFLTAHSIKRHNNFIFIPSTPLSFLFSIFTSVLHYQRHVTLFTVLSSLCTLPPGLSWSPPTSPFTLSLLSLILLCKSLSHFTSCRPSSGYLFCLTFLNYPLRLLGEGPAIHHIRSSECVVYRKYTLSLSNCESSVLSPDRAALISCLFYCSNEKQPSLVN